LKYSFNDEPPASRRSISRQAGHVLAQHRLVDRPTADPDVAEIHVRKIEIIELSPEPPTSEPGFQPLFNGKDLTEWKGDKTIWSVKDGDLIANLTGKFAK
jgi:hypothetical protein